MNNYDLLLLRQNDSLYFIYTCILHYYRMFSIPFQCTLYLLYTSRGVFIWRINYCQCHIVIQHLNDATLTLPINEHLQFHASQYKQKTQHPSHPLHKHTTYFNTPRLKHYFYFYQRPLHNRHSHKPPHSHYNRHKNKHAPYTYIY